MCSCSALAGSRLCQIAYMSDCLHVCLDAHCGREKSVNARGRSRRVLSNLHAALISHFRCVYAILCMQAFHNALRMACMPFCRSGATGYGVCGDLAQLPFRHSVNSILHRKQSRKHWSGFHYDCTLRCFCPPAGNQSCLSTTQSNTGYAACCDSSI